MKMLQEEMAKDESSDTKEEAEPAEEKNEKKGKKPTQKNTSPRSEPIESQYNKAILQAYNSYKVSTFKPAKGKATIDDLPK